MKANAIMSRKAAALVLVASFVVSFGFFFALQTKPVFPDPDSFYHIKIAQLIAGHGVVQNFPWLTFTGLGDYYTDQHFLYHVFLAPFVSNFDPIFGAKLATVIIDAALITLLAAFLISSRVRWWWAFLLILFVTNPFLFRMNLVKAPGFSIILLVIGLWLLFARRVLPLFLLSFLYVWAYGGFVLLGWVALVYLVVAALLGWARHRALASLFRRLTPRRRRWRQIAHSKLTMLLAAVAGGLTVGVLVHPYFPKNLFFYWQQLVQIGIINFQKVVNVGGEWHPYGFVELLANTVFVSIAVLLALVFLAIFRRRQSAESWTLGALWLFFFLITLKSRRYVELYVPFSVLFAAFSFRDALAGVRFWDLWKRLTTLFERRWVLVALLGAYILTASTMVIIRDERQLVQDLASGFSPTYLSAASQWLAKNTPEGSIVVHSDWDEFPILFYHNDHNRYIVGLDPTFMYQYDKTLYQRWAELTSGNRTDVATPIILNDLKSSVVLVAKDHQPFRRTMEAQKGFTMVYEDEDAWIYRLTEPAPSFGEQPNER